MFELCTWLGWGDPFCKDLRTSLSLSLSLSIGIESLPLLLWKEGKKIKTRIAHQPLFQRTHVCYNADDAPWEKG
jgi:hypothetical protein